MKFIVFGFYLLVAVCTEVFGQDQIILHSAQELKGKVTEVKIDRIVYKDESNPDGPSIELPKGDVFMIIYKNGSTLKISQSAASSQPNSPTEVAKPRTNEPKPKQDRFGRSKQDNLTLFDKRLKTGIPLTVIGIPCIVVGARMIDDVVSRRPGTPTISGPFSNLTDAEALGIGIPLAAIGVAFTIIGPINIGAAINYRVKANQLANNTTLSPYLPVSQVYSGAVCQDRLGFGFKIQHTF
jgi:hypothetical protein